MRWRHCIAEATGHLWGCADSAYRVGAICRTSGNRVVLVQLDVRRQVAGKSRSGGTRAFAGFQCPLTCGRINLAEVVDAGIGLRGGAGFHEVGNRDGRQEADDGHDDHDFHQCETGFTKIFYCLHFIIFLLVCGVNRMTGELQVLQLWFTHCLS